MTTGIRLDYVDTAPTRQVVSAVATHHNGTKYRLGHLPHEGWFCTCSRAKRCPHLQTLADLIPGIAPPAPPKASTPTAPPAPDGVPRE